MAEALSAVAAKASPRPVAKASWSASRNPFAEPSKVQSPAMTAIEACNAFDVVIVVLSGSQQNANPGCQAASLCTAREYPPDAPEASTFFSCFTFADKGAISI